MIFDFRFTNYDLCIFREEVDLAIKAVLFDFDGVIANTLTYHVQAWQQVFDKYEVEIVPEDENLKKQCEQDVKDKVKTKWQRWNRGNSGYYDKKSKHGRDWRWPGGYGGHGWDGYEYNDPYDYGSSYNDSKISLKEDIVEDIKNLADFIFDHGFTAEAMRSFIYDLLQNAIKNKYEDKAECRDGIGTYDENEQLCEKCAIAKQCKLFTEKSEELKYEDFDITDSVEESISECDVEVIVDPNN